MSREAKVMRELRSKVLAASPRDLGLTPTQEHPRVWGILMETGSPDGAVTLVAVLDGSASLYFSNGSGIIGAGEHAPVRRAAFKFISTAEAYVEDFSRTTEYPLPETSRVKFYLLTYSGIFTGDFEENLLGEGGHKLSTLFYAGHDVITEIRKKTEKRLPR